MKSIRFVTPILFAVVCAGGARAQLPTAACENDSIPLTYSGPLGRLESSFLQTNTRAEGKIEYVNKQSLGLTAVTFLVDYLDGKHERMFTLMYYACVVKDRSDTKFFHRQFGRTVGDFKGSLGPGQSIVILGSSPVTSTECPTSAEVTLVNAKTVDGATNSWSIPDWHLDADIAAGPAHIKLPVSVISGNIEFFATAEIHQDGKLTEFGSTDKTGMAILSKLQGQLALLKFLPPVSGGQTIDGRLTFLFRFHTKPGMRALRDLGPVRREAPFTVLDFLLAPSSKDRWDLLYANVQVPSD
jgi:hypothetical protein